MRKYMLSVSVKISEEKTMDYIYYSDNLEVLTAKAEGISKNKSAEFMYNNIWEIISEELEVEPGIYIRHRQLSKNPVKSF